MSPETLISRVRGEFTEMPGLRLTLPQACRLWQLDPETCQMMLEQLVADRFLLTTGDGAFVRVPRRTESVA